MREVIEGGPAGAQGAAAIAVRRDPGRQPRGDLPVSFFAHDWTTAVQYPLRNTDEPRSAD